MFFIIVFEDTLGRFTNCSFDIDLHREKNKLIACKWMMREYNRALYMDWDAKEFSVVPAGKTIEPSYDDTILRVAD